MKALVTGAGGFIGGAIARALLMRGHEVRSLARGDYPDLHKLGVEAQRGDIADSAAVSRAVKGCDSVFHVAARFDLWGRYDDFYRVNTQGTKNVIACCREQHVPRLIYTSTPSVVHGGGDVSGVDESVPYPSHFEAHYPATKALAEQAVLAANGADLATTALRPHLVWGPGDTSALPRLVARAKSGRLRQVGTGRLIDTCYIDNCVAAHLQAEERLREPNAACAGNAYFVTQDEPLPGPHFMNDLLAAAGMPPIERSVPAPVAKAAARVIELVWTVLRKQTEPPVTRFMVSTLCTEHYYDIGAARRDLGYEPGVNYREGMKLLKEWVKRARPFD